MSFSHLGAYILAHSSKQNCSNSATLDHCPATEPRHTSASGHGVIDLIVRRPTWNMDLQRQVIPTDERNPHCTIRGKRLSNESMEPSKPMCHTWWLTALLRLKSKTSLSKSKCLTSLALWKCCVNKDVLYCISSGGIVAWIVWCFLIYFRRVKPALAHNSLTFLRWDRHSWSKAFGRRQSYT